MLKPTNLVLRHVYPAIVVNRSSTGYKNKLRSNHRFLDYDKSNWQFLTIKQWLLTDSDILTLSSGKSPGKSYGTVPRCKPDLLICIYDFVIRVWIDNLVDVAIWFTYFYCPFLFFRKTSGRTRPIFQFQHFFVTEFSELSLVPSFLDNSYTFWTNLLQNLSMNKSINCIIFFSHTFSVDETLIKRHSLFFSTKFE